MKRRPKGTGTIEKTRGGKFRARFAFKRGSREDIDGNPFATHTAAEAALDALLLALEDAGAVQGGITLRKLGEKALAQRDVDGYRSQQSYQDIFDLRIDSWERATLPASTTTKGDVRAWLAEMRKQNGKRPSASTKKNALNALRMIYAYGVDNELVEENPCDGIKVKDHGTTLETSTILTLPEQTRLLAAAADPAVELKMWTGLRSGELRSLLWSDVGDDSITVRYGKPGEPAKNGKIRIIPILAGARRALDRLPRTHAMVLPSKTDGFRARGQVFDRVAWKTWLRAAKLTRRVRPHDLRHTCATSLLNGDWGRKWTYEEVKEMLGHSSVKVTERYAKVLGTLAQRAAAEMTLKPETSPQENASIVAKAREMLRRRGSDSNRRMTVLQSQHRPYGGRAEVDVAGLSRAFVEAVAHGDPHAIRMGLDLAEAAWSSTVSKARIA